MLKKIAILAVATLAMMQTAHAGNWSVGVLAGQASTDVFKDVCDEVSGIGFLPEPRLPEGFFVVGVGCEADDSDTALGLNVAYNFNQRWGLELGYMDLGEYDADISVRSLDPRVVITGGEQTVSNELSALYLVGTVNFGFGNGFSLTGRLGVADIELDISSDFVSESEDGTEAMVGISLNYDFTDKIRAELRYDYFDAEESIDAATVGVRFGF